MVAASGKNRKPGARQELQTVMVMVFGIMVYYCLQITGPVKITTE
jgi:hypothetical protein